MFQIASVFLTVLIINFQQRLGKLRLFSWLFHDSNFHAWFHDYLSFYWSILSIQVWHTCLTRSFWLVFMIASQNVTDSIKINRPDHNIRMFWTNFWQPTTHVQQNIFEKTFTKSGSLHFYASFGPFCVKIGQLFEA